MRKNNPGNIRSLFKFLGAGCIVLCAVFFDLEISIGQEKLDVTIYNQANTPSLPTNFFQRVAIDSKDNIWVGTNGQGILKFDPANSTWERAFTTHVVRSLVKDELGGILAGSANSGVQAVTGGIRRYASGSMSNPVSYNIVGETYPIVSRYVYQLTTATENSVWAAHGPTTVPDTEGGIGRFKDGIWYKITAGLPASDRRITAITSVGDRVWAGIDRSCISGVCTEPYIAEYDKNGTFIKQISAGLEIVNQIGYLRDLFQDSKGRVWVGLSTGTGVVGVYENNKWTLLSNLKLGLSTGTAVNSESIAEDGSGNIWIGTTNGLLKLSAADYSNTDNWKVYTTTNDLPVNNITGIAANSTGLWLASSLGIVNLRLSQKPKPVITFNVLPQKVYGNADFSPGGSSTNSTTPLTYTSSNPAVATIVGGQIHIVGAGLTTITAIQVADAEFDAATSVSRDLIVNRKSLQITADAKSKLLQLPDPDFTYVTVGLLTGDAVSGALTRTAGELAGVYPILIGTLTAGNNYDITYVSNNLTISKASISITILNKAKVYGASDPPFTYIVSGTLDPGDQVSGLPSRTPGENVGFYEISQGSLSAGPKYALIIITGKLLITQKPIKIIADAKTKVYTELDPVLTYTLEGTLEPGDNFTGNLSRQTGEDAGSYPILNNTLSAGSNYEHSFTGANFTITRKPIRVSAAATKVYGSADPPYTLLPSEVLPLGIRFTGSPARVAGENVGTYTILQNTLRLDNNYEIIFTPTFFTIVKAPLLITPDNKAKAAGTANPVFTVSYTGFVFNQTNAELITQPQITSTATTNSAEGDYPITASGATAQNYSISYAPGILKIGPVQPIVNAFEPKTAGRGAIVTINGRNFMNATAVSFGGIAAASFKVVSDGVITAVVGLGASGAISVTTSTGTGTAAGFTFAPIIITITAQAKNKIYGATDPFLTYTYTGALAQGDAIKGNLIRGAGEDAGIYKIEQGTLSAGPSYTINFTGADFTINKKTISVKASAKEKVYGKPDPVLTFEPQEALIAGDKLLGSLSRDQGENTGLYAITRGNLNGGNNYVINYIPATLNIGPAILNIAADNKSKLEGAGNPELTVSFTGFANGENKSVLSMQPSINTTAVQNSPSGNYPIFVGGAAAPNYTMTYTEGTLTILPSPPIISSFDPATSGAGELITIVGNYFNNVEKVSFGGTPAAAFVVVSPTKIVATTGAGASGVLEIKTGTGSTTLPGYTFVPIPIVTADGPLTFIKGGIVTLKAIPGTGFTYQWSKDGFAIAGATTPNFIATESGFYTVTITANAYSKKSVPVEVNAIFTLPVNNFKLAARGETCKTANNGSLTIEALQDLKYTAVISGDNVFSSKQFTKTLTFNDLPSGTHTVCITIEGQTGYKQCFDILITEPKDLAVYVTMVHTDNKISLSMEGGTIYNIELNGVKQQTTESQINLQLTEGKNILKVSTNKDCQGVFEKQIFIQDRVLIYPNPFENILSVSLSEIQSDVTTVQVQSLNGVVVYNHIMAAGAKELTMSLGDLVPGMYIIRVSGPKLQSVYKVLKK